MLKANIYALFFHNNTKDVKEADLLSEKPRVQFGDVNYDTGLS